MPLSTVPGGLSLPETLRRFSFNGTPTAEVEEGGLRYFVNEFWTAGQRQGHSLHEVSYRACFKAQLPEFLIERLTAPGDTVYDPFSGRGTTALQAALMGRRAIANDVNPLSAMLARPRLDPPPLAAIGDRLAVLELSAAEAPEDLLVFYHPATLGRIAALRRYLRERDAAGRLDAVDDWVRMVALNRLTGHSNGFFSVYTLPPNQAVSVDRQRRINAARNQTPPVRDIAALILRKSKSLLADGLPAPHPAPLFLTGPAEETPAIADRSVDLLVTSPPFLDVVDYEGDNWLRCWFAGIDPRSVRIDRHRTVEAWEGFIRRAFHEFARIMHPGGTVAFEVGEVRGGRVLLERHVVAAIEGLPFDVMGVMVNQQAFTKTANCWGVRNNNVGTNTNRIVLARRCQPA
ncbi:MAG: DNA methyltransferase [Acetobacteraceae bacterium]